jgi:VIT1/CCC1 family predicted Fe2+/Mn2+ transporter
MPGFKYVFILCLVRTVQTNEALQFMMDFELKLEKSNVSRAWISGATMGLSYFIGAFA